MSDAAHRSSSATHPALILGRPEGGSPRVPSASRALCVGSTTPCGALLSDHCADLPSDVSSFSDCGY
jgi:hypothetical protein